MAIDLFKGSGPQGDRHRIRSGGPPQKEIKEKNYFFVMWDDLPNIDLPESTTGKQFYGKLFLSVTALQDMFIGSGEIDEFNKRLYDTFSYFKQEPDEKAVRFTIPGSSIKGCIKTNMMLFLKERSTDFLSAQNGMAKVYFSDFPVTDSSGIDPRTIAGRFNPRIDPPENAILKLYLKDDLAYANLSKEEWRELQSKENILTVKQGSRFNGFINFKLLGLKELVFLVLSLGCMTDHGFCFKIGGAKNRGMGLIKTELDWQKSFYASSLKELSLNNGKSFNELQPQLVSTLSQLKQDFPRIDYPVKRMQKEYGG
jgi:CRISPR/Cas system CSM-associated protein Csm3 (group 7 of RAMP superfamily)